MSGVNDIRSTFLDYFRKNGHEVVASSPLVPRNDPTLMFTNAGMVQFKNVFTGLEKRPYSTATTAQKCVRAGGKHNDLDNVGYTARHLTYFEMLGNFSFGDYFKDRAIELAWNLITKDFGLPKDKLLVTVYHTDDEAASLWKKIAGFSDDRIIRIPTSDNFWAMGDTGPCGPCSEIFIDRGEHIWGGPPGSPEEDGDRFIEIWNLVFMQYEQVTKEERTDLPRPSIDTGMGLERMASILQGVESVFETDLFRHLIEATASALGKGPDKDNTASFRVIADHLRSSAFLIADGVLPSNEGRGYVLRRIMRRAMRHGQLLGAAEPLMFKLVPALVREMGQAYPELLRGEALITETLKLEETRFRKTLARGLTLLEEAAGGLSAGDMLDGETAFKLYDTYGFPLDLTQDALRQRNISVNLDGFNDAMERQRAEARANWAGSGEAATETIWFALREKLGATEFLGYDTEKAEGVVLALVKNGKEAASAAAGETVAVIVNQTPFYGESGGQVGDTGELRSPSGHFEVDDTLKLGGVFAGHAGTWHGERALRVGDVLEAQVDGERRQAIVLNHSATHLLHAALRAVLGTHVTQKGSLVAPDRLRFDFSHFKPLSAEELAAVETLVNGEIRRNQAAVIRQMPYDEAIGSGAMALFGEKYGDVVRVLRMGDFSTELCGGTHVQHTGDIGLFKIVSEAGVASGVRRIEAVTGDAALARVAAEEHRLGEIARLLSSSAEDVVERLNHLLERQKKLERELESLRGKAADSLGAELAQQAEDVGGLKVVAARREGLDAKALRDIVDQLKQELGDCVVVLAGAGDGRVALVAGVHGAALERVKAGDVVAHVAAQIGGKGGGRRDLAQGGGMDGPALGKALAAVPAWVAAQGHQASG